ncbi:hypothetical protein ACO0K9_20815 [Undibacterium sp. Ji50W]|uniref:hypothetical protein n=1 Tax=Undibacterium sp. Ji50W TaxID=3413041 RepID=UPI003BF1695E
MTVSKEKIAEQMASTRKALNEINLLAEQNGGIDSIPTDQLQDYIAQGRINSSLIGGMVRRFNTSPGEASGFGSSVASMDTAAAVASQTEKDSTYSTVTITDSPGLLFQAGKWTSVGGGVIAGMFQNVVGIGKAMTLIAQHPIDFISNEVSKTFDEINTKLNAAGTSGDFGDYFLYGAAVGHATMGLAASLNLWDRCGKDLR